MEGMDLIALFGGAYKKRTVLVTGHTGFKGSWLALWLHHLGARVGGYSLAPPTEPNHWDLLAMRGGGWQIGDVRREEAVRIALADTRPEIVFHLAAQPLVRRSYDMPSETFATNIMGTVHVLEACRLCESVQAVVIVTSDKCYDLKAPAKRYGEDDRCGGHDPYSASKGCAELIVSSYRRSFFSGACHGGRRVLLASVRAGNVIGGGDWAQDRLIPDAVRAAIKRRPFAVRRPHARRPWQHVLESLSGYLRVGQELLADKSGSATAWNFGPRPEDTITVEFLLEKLRHRWEHIRWERTESAGPYETDWLELDCSKARTLLGWEPVWNIDEAVEMTVDWYRRYYEQRQVISAEQLGAYVRAARDKGMGWALS
jgi:CDP-glucose 4,6-dehydratase